jgi:hypothetical protein
MTSDPIAYIVFASLLGGAIGFFACALFASRKIKQIDRTRWREGYAAANRDHARRRESSI